MIFVWLLLLVPVSLVAEYVLHLPPLWVFVTAVLAIIPLAEWIRRATEQLAEHTGPAVGGLINVSFGNMAELILALFVLSAGHHEVVKAQITGSIIGNCLLSFGLAVLVGSWGRAKQTFSRERAGLQSSLLVLAVLGLIVPALFNYTELGLEAPNVSALNESLSLGVAAVLILVYIGHLVYTLVTHRNVFSREHEKGQAKWSLFTALAVLVGATAVTALQAELVSGALVATAATLGLTPFFLGITVLAVIGNAAEYISAVYFARQDRMGLVLSITVGSSIQIALLVAPLLVIVSYLMGSPMDLVFSNPLELIAIAGAAFIVRSIASDGESTWFEGLLLLAVYTILGLAFFYVTP
ncbi:MAG TPA: calcium/proton exchanger [Trueperaceae bacterium]|nr:calcium/proton exchanger [Trueperaceae bacterium]